MEGKEAIEAKVNILIALYHILDGYSEFTKNLISFITTKNNKNDVWDLYKITHGEFVVGAIKTKKFYQKNKDVIDTINKYSSIWDFILYNYDDQGNVRKDSFVDYFYQYFLAHKNELDKILSILEKLKELGFDRFRFDEDADFTDKECTISTHFNSNSNINYLDNIQVVPNYQNDVVRYKTTGSNYNMNIKVFLGRFGYEKTITLNSLVFDVKRLPESISKESIFDRIISLKGEQKESCAAIKNSVDLSIGVDDLQSQFESTSQIIDRLDDIKDKDELHEVLSHIKEEIDKLQTISKAYNDTVSKDDSSITKEQLQKEKKRYLARRNSTNFD